MAVVVLTSAGHAPGVTTTALGLALAWPRPVLLVDADRTPTQAVLAGYLRGEHPGQRGLGRLLQAVRERRGIAEVLDDETIELPPLLASDEPPRLLPGFPHPGVVDLFATAWPDLMAALTARDGDVLIDAGRIGAEGLPAAVTQRADLVLVVTAGTTHLIVPDGWAVDVSSLQSTVSMMSVTGVRTRPKPGLPRIVVRGQTNGGVYVRRTNDRDRKRAAKHLAQNRGTPPALPRA